MKYVVGSEFPLTQEEFERSIKEAEQYLYTFGLGGVSEDVGRVNSHFFIAKIRKIQQELGYKPHVMIIGSPEFSFQKYPHKLYDSVPDGAKVIWGNGDYDFVPAELDFDFCGMLVGAIDTDIKLEDIIERINVIRNKKYTIDKKRIDTKNFAVGNHFIEVYEVNDYAEKNLPKRVGVLHCSSDEMRDRLREFVREKGDRLTTPFGGSSIVKGSDARVYIDQCKYSSNFARKKRELLFKEVFRNDRILLNHNHYELTSPNEGIISCNKIGESEIYFVSLKDDSHLIKKKEQPSKKLKEIASNAKEDWVRENIEKADILPHGGRDEMGDVDSIEAVLLYPDMKVFVMKRGPYTRAYSDFKSLPRYNRNGGILQKAFSLDLAEPYADLKSVYRVKIN